MRNNNGAIVRKIAVSWLKHNQLQKRLTIMAIALATMLITAVLLSAFSIANVNINQSNALTGSYHAVLTGIEPEQYLSVKQDQRTETVGLTAPVGMSKSGDTQLNMSWSDPNALALNSLSVSAGTMPQQENEILIEKDYLDSQNLAAGIGDRISLNFMNRNGGAAAEMEFVISGYLKTPASGSNRALYAAVVSESFFEAQGGWQAFVSTLLFRVGNASSLTVAEIADRANEILQSAGIDRAPVINEAYLALSKPSFLIIATMTAAILIIVIAGVLVINCVFHISILDAIKELGQLRTVGTTARQIRKLVFWQGAILSVQAIPGGLILGTLAALLFVPQGFQPTALLWAWPLAAALAYCSVWFSVRKPARTAAAIAPIEASRYSGQKAARTTRIEFSHLRFLRNRITRISGRKTDCPDVQLSSIQLLKAGKKKAGSPATLAKKSLRRDKKKNLLTMFSIAFAGVLLCCLSSVLFSVNTAAMSRQGFPDGQFIIRINDTELMKNSLEQVQVNNPMTADLLSDLRTVSGVTKITVSHNLPAATGRDAAESNIWLEDLAESDWPLLEKYTEFYQTKDYQELAETNGIIIGRPGDFAERFGFHAEPGQTVTLKIFDGADSRMVDFTVAGIIDENKSHEDNVWRFDTVMIPLESMARLANANTVMQYTVQVSENLARQAESEIGQILQNRAGIQVRTLAAAIAENENFMQSLKWALGVAVAFITCFAMMNLVNTILTGVTARKNEFALLRSVGMTLKQLGAMVRYESLFVSVGALVCSVTVGGSAGALLCMGLQNRLMSYLHYRFPVMPMVLYCVIVVIGTLAAVTAALKRQNKFSLIEQLRDLAGE